MKENLSHMIVHDMNNILGGILAYSSVLEDSLTSPQQLEHMEKIMKYGNELQNFINDILLIAKSQKDKLVLNRTEVDPKEILLNSEETFRASGERKKIKILTELPQENLSVSIDKYLFQRLLDNLISNSIKFSLPGTSVTLRMEYLPPPKSVRFSVLDQGKGIDKEKRDKIFDIFEIIDMKKKNVSQVGLGLAFCKMVTDAHGGRIFVEDNKPKGSIFVVEI
jgi:signal transduction histidine kinase